MSLHHAREILNAEMKAIESARENLDGSFEKALDLLQNCSGHIVACGMGKAGFIAQKVSATLSSTGAPSFYLHPADALHGDLGMVSPGDAALIFSNSGESEEVTRLLPCLRGIAVEIIAITASERSTLAAHADVAILIGEIREACPLGLAPTATTTAMLAVGDALAMCLLDRKDFKIHDYARFHPAGALGRKTMPVEALMRVGDAVATVPPEAKVAEAILAVTRARSGAAVVVDAHRKVLGIFCDGDLRRGLEADRDILARAVGAVMTKNCATLRTGTLAGEALDLMREKRIAEIPVVDETGALAGMADMKGLVASM